jgi:hypothetical protein
MRYHEPTESYFAGLYQRPLTEFSGVWVRLQPSWSAGLIHRARLPERLQSAVVAPRTQRFAIACATVSLVTASRVSLALGRVLRAGLQLAGPLQPAPRSRQRLSRQFILIRRRDGQ